MSRHVLLSDSNLRVDNRRPLEIRPHIFSFDHIQGKEVDGSAYVEQGLTRVAATVSGPKPSPQSSLAASKDRVIINVEIDWIHFSGTEKRPRGKNDRRLVELASSVKNTFEPVILAHLYPKSTIEIGIIVLDQDGGILPAAINATSLALLHAGISLSSPVSSISLSCLHDTPFLDPNSIEESELPTLTAACLNNGGKITLINMETRLSIERFEGMLNLAADTVRVIGNEIDRVSREWTEATSGRMEQGRKGLEAKRLQQS